jgi:endoglucanase
MQSTPKTLVWCAFLIALVLATLGTPTIASAHTQSIVDYHGRLRTRAGDFRLYGEKSGQLAAPAGFSLDILKLRPEVYTAQTVHNLHTQYNAQLIRIAMDGFDQTGPTYNSDAYKNAISTVIDAAIAEGIYVVVSWEDLAFAQAGLSSGTRVSVETGFFNWLSQKYKNSPNLIYEIWSVPGYNLTWSEHIRPPCVAIINAIRQVDPINLIICPTPTFDTDFAAAAASPIPDVNLAYALQYFTFFKASSLFMNPPYYGMPIFISGWSANLRDDYLNSFTSWLSSNPLPIAAWSIGTANDIGAQFEMGSFTRENTNFTGPWVDTELTTSGSIITQFVKQWPHNTLPTTPPPSPTPIVRLNAGGVQSGDYQPDAYFSGGNVASRSGNVDSSLITGSVPPMNVLLSERWGASTYTIPSLTPNKSYTVNLYFVESYFNAIGQRLFNVAINGIEVLTAFDIFKETGASFKAIKKSFNVSSNSVGIISIEFREGAANHPAITAIEVVPQNFPPAITSIPNQVIANNGTPSPISFVVSDAETDPAALIVSATTDNAQLLGTPVIAGSGANRTVTITHSTYLTGSGKVKLTVTDEAGASSSTIVSVIVKSIPILDSNLNNTSDIWEALYPNLQPAADNDGDGMNNRQEELAGTDPTNPASKFAANIGFDSQGAIQLSWLGIKGKHYKIEYSDNLKSWNTLPTEYIGSGVEIQANPVLPSGVTASRMFFRLRVFDFDTGNTGLNDWEREQTSVIASVVATSNSGGMISPLGKSYAAKGGSLTYTIQADNPTTTAIDTVTVDGINVGSVNTYTFTNISAGDHTISATFKKISP